MKKRLIVSVLALMLIPNLALSQTIGTKFPGADAYKEVWQITIPSGDSVSTYFLVPRYVDKIIAHIGPLTAGGIAFEAATDTSRLSGGMALSDFFPVQTKAAVLDSIASTSGSIVVDITDQCQGAAAIRVHVGYNATVAQGGLRGIYILIRKKPPQ